MQTADTSNNTDYRSDQTFHWGDSVRCGQMGDGFLDMSCGRLNFRSILYSFLEMLDRFIHMRVLLSLFGMLESFFGMLLQGIGMFPFALRYGFLGMFQRLSLCVSAANARPLAKGRPTSAETAVTTNAVRCI